MDSRLHENDRDRFLLFGQAGALILLYGKDRDRFLLFGQARALILLYGNDRERFLLVGQARALILLYWNDKEKGATDLDSALNVSDSVYFSIIIFLVEVYLPELMR